MIRELDRRTGRAFSTIIGEGFGRCPAGCAGPHPTGVIYRSSKRSVTLRCRICGLLWTMTVHQMAKSAEVHAERVAAVSPGAVELACYNAQLLSSWSDIVADRRGHRSGRVRFFERDPPE